MSNDNPKITLTDIRGVLMEQRGSDRYSWRVLVRD